jgi:hypothetical protein
MLQPVHRVGLLDAPAIRIAAHAPGHPSSTANPDFSRFRLSGFNKIKHLQLMF